MEERACWVTRAKGSQKEVVSFLIRQDHMAFLPVAPGVYS
jgi:hypothetical protein